MIEIKEGDFVVTKGRYSIGVKKVLKVTPSFFYHSTDYMDRPTNDRPFREARGEIVFAGAETDARDLAEQLKASRMTRTSAERAAYDEWQERDARLIEAALTARMRTRT